MGYLTEFNWFIVVKQESDIQKSEYDNAMEIVKQGRRTYPVGKGFSLPIIINDKAYGLAYIRQCIIREDSTIITFVPVIIFEENDAIAEFYTTQYTKYKEKEEEINDGGYKNLVKIFLERLNRDTPTNTGDE